MITRALTLLAVMMVLADCGGAPRREWDNLDYSGIANKRGENDSSYTPPISNNCLEDFCQ